MSEHIVIGGKKYLVLKTGYSSNKPGSSSPVIRFKEKKQWNTQQTFELIRLYREKPQLYDTSHDEYQSRGCRKRAYWSISQGLTNLRPNTSEEDIRTKWNSLRTQFMREYSKAQKAADDGLPFKPGMLFYESLLFLKDVDAAKTDCIILDEPEVCIHEGSTEIKLEDESESKSQEADSQNAEKLSDPPTHSDHSYESSKESDRKCDSPPPRPPPAKQAREAKKEKNIFALVVDANHVKPQKKSFCTTVIPRSILPAPSGITVSTPTGTPGSKPFDGLCQYIGETLRSLPLSQARRLEQRLLTSLITFMSNMNDP